MLLSYFTQLTPADDDNLVNPIMPPLPTSEDITGENSAAFDIIQHGHKDLVQAIAFNAYGDRCATGSVDGKIRVFNRHQDGIWRLCDNWKAHAGEILEVSWSAFCAIDICGWLAWNRF